MNVNFIKKSSFAVILLSASSGALAVPTVKLTKEVSADITVAGASTLDVTMTPADALNSDMFGSPTLARVPALTYVATVNSGALLAARFVEPITGMTDCTVAKGSANVNSELVICKNAASGPNNTFELDGKTYYTRVSGQTYTLDAPLGQQKVSPDAYKVKMEFVNYTN